MSERRVTPRVRKEEKINGVVVSIKTVPIGSQRHY